MELLGTVDKEMAGRKEAIMEDIETRSVGLHSHHTYRHKYPENPHGAIYTVSFC